MLLLAQNHGLCVVCVPKGLFLLLDGSGLRDGETASVSAAVETLSATVCVGFWYQMSGPSVPSLNLMVKTVCTLLHNIIFFCFLLSFLYHHSFLYLLQKSSEHSIWTRQGTHNPEWINARVNINLNGMQKASIVQPNQVTVCVACSIRILNILPVFTVDIHWLQKRQQSGIRCH